MKHKAETIEDLLEMLAGMRTGAKIDIESSDATIMYSIARQVFKGTPLTDRQFALMQEKLQAYKPQFLLYKQNFDMPQNGPDHKKGLAYFVRKGDLLVVTVETFEVVEDSMRIQVAGQQLEWLQQTLAEHRDAPFKIVQGHVGLWGDLNSRSSSRLMLEGGKQSAFYKTLVANGVDAYFAGEFHDVTVLEADGIWQIVHGSSWGRAVVNTQDYLVGEVKKNQLHLTLKRLYMEVDGGHIWNVNKPRGPREIVRISEQSLTNGPEITGTLTITNNNGKKSFSNQTGYFALDHEN